MNVQYWRTKAEQAERRADNLERELELLKSAKKVASNNKDKKTSVAKKFMGKKKTVTAK